MIVVFVDSQHDTSMCRIIYSGLGAKILSNPSKRDVIKVLKENPTETLLAFGHGGVGGLFGTKDPFVIDDSMLDLLRGREIIGIWCYARRFAVGKGLKGYFTDMFVSNPNEARWFAFDAVTESETDEENVKFAKAINSFIKENVPMENWVEILNENCDKSKDYVKFNYDNMAYFDGTEPEAPFGNTNDGDIITIV